MPLLAHAPDAALVLQLHDLDLEIGPWRPLHAKEREGAVVTRGGRDAGVEELAGDHDSDRGSAGLAGNGVNLAREEEIAVGADGPAGAVDGHMLRPTASAALQVAAARELRIGGVIGIELSPAPEAAEVWPTHGGVVAVEREGDLPLRLAAVG
jgi:hypothetical protein